MDERDRNGASEACETVAGSGAPQEALPAAGTAAPETPEGEGEAVPARLRSILESVLFAAGDPISLGRLAQIVTGYERPLIQRALGALAEEYQRDERGFRLQHVAGGYQLRTARANADFVRHLVEQRPVRLTRAALETLAIVAYRQPVTRAEIEAIRGVDVDAVLTTLLERRLLRVLGRKDVIGRPLLYGTTSEFLEAFGLKDLSSLPTLRELGASVDVLERAAERVRASEQDDPAAASTQGPAPEPAADGAQPPATAAGETQSR